VNSVVPEVAAVGLHNYVAGRDDPTELEAAEVKPSRANMESVHKMRLSNQSSVICMPALFTQ
jgi:hypothetical protein